MINRLEAGPTLTAEVLERFENLVPQPVPLRVEIPERSERLACVSQGAIREEAMTNIKDAIAGCMEVRAEQGLECVHWN